MQGEPSFLCEAVYSSLQALVSENANRNFLLMFQDHLYYPLISEGARFQTESCHTWSEPGSVIISSGLRLVKPILLVILVGNMQLLGLQRSVVFGPTVTKPSYGVPQPLWKDELHRLAISCHAYCCSRVQMEDPDQLPYHSARRADGEVTCQF